MASEVSDLDRAGVVKGVVLATEIHPGYLERFRELCQEEDRSMAAQLRVLVREYVDGHYR